MLSSLSSLSQSLSTGSSTVSKSPWGSGYSLYILSVLMLVYMMSQMERFVLGIASYQISRDLKIGHLTCYPNHSIADCGDNNCSLYKYDREQCHDSDECLWDYTATSIYYQLLAGPAFLVSFALASLPMGLVASLPYIRRSTLLSVLSLIWSIVICLSGFAKEYWQLILTRIALGMLQASCTPLAGSIIGDIFSTMSRGAAIGFYSWGVYIGYSLAFAANFIVQALNWRWAFWITSIPGVIISLVALLTVREPPRAAVEKEMMPRKFSSYRLLLKRVIASYMQLPLLFLCVGAGLRQGGGLVWAYNAKAYFRQLHCNDTDIGTYLSWVPVVGGSVGVFIGGWLSDGLVRRWGMKARVIVLITCSFLASPFLFGTLYAVPPWAFLFLLFAYFTGEMWFGVCIAVAIEMVPPDISSSGIALYFFVINIIGGNINLILPPLQRLIGLRGAMVILYPGMYMIAGLLFTVAGLLWACQSSRCHGKEGRDEKRPLLIQQADDDDDIGILTESQEIKRMRSKHGRMDSQVKPVTFRYSLSLTASM